MKAIISADYYTDKTREIREYERKIQEQNALMTDNEHKAATEKRMASMEQLRKQLTELKESVHVRKRRLSVMRFQSAAQNAQSIAERFSLDVRVVKNGHYGFVRFYTDDFISDRLWKDQQYLKPMLKYMRWADSVAISQCEKKREGQFVIELTFRLYKLVGKGRLRYKNLEKLFF